MGALEINAESGQDQTLVRCVFASQLSSNQTDPRLAEGYVILPVEGAQGIAGETLVKKGLVYSVTGRVFFSDGSAVGYGPVAVDLSAEGACAQGSQVVQVNVAQVFAPIDAQTVNAGTQLTFTASVTDADDEGRARAGAGRARPLLIGFFWRRRKRRPSARVARS